MMNSIKEIVKGAHNDTQHQNSTHPKNSPIDCDGWPMYNVTWYLSCRVSDQGTTLRASDLHNARATILNPFYNMEYKIIKKIRQNTTWIEADILGINLTPNRYNALAPAIVYVNNDVTIPFNSVTSQ